MADVFLSYGREDTARAEQVAKGLEAAGLDVFWDNEIPPGTTWADYIESKLTQCKALIVLWSEHSTKSQWVREEARMGRDKG
ncbi:MAG: toll/interleukin-1 receptor domain-containing protein, partial [Hyphomonadaceae bacterium]|nr:toll/interleukin-1 receptor domain-containing protein [Hyphomonadaceae bacterium]